MLDGVTHMQPFFNENLKKPSIKVKLAMVGATLVGIFGISFPVKSVVSTNSIQTNTKPIATTKTSALDTINEQKALTIAIVANHTTYFADTNFEHGFGFDVMRGYAKHLGVTLRPMVFDNEQEVLEAIKSGKADVALTTMHPQTATDNTVSHIMLSCGKSYLKKYGLNEHVSLQMPLGDNQFYQNANDYLCQDSVMTTHQQLASFHTQQTFDDNYSKHHFRKTMKETLPLYRSSFKQHANKHKLDLDLLVAMGYQESHLDAEAVSPTGVKGLMMLTNDTAEEMGISDRENPIQSIQGGAKYVQKLQNQFNHVADADRIWFTVASYNMGSQAVKNIQATLHKKGMDGNSWAEVYRYMAENQHKNSRYTQCLQYVTNIRGYIETLKLDTLDLKKPNKSEQKSA